MASRRRGAAVDARIALEQCRVRAARIHRPDLSALALSELGALELSTGDAAAAAVCFWFARDAFRLIDREREARAAELLALTAFVEGGRVDEAIALATDAIAEADQRGDAETAARAAGLYADALIARGDLDLARAAADAAAERACGLSEREALRLGASARLRQVRLARSPEQQVRHLEAAIDLALSLRDQGALARALDVAVGGLVAGTLPADGWRAVAELARASRELGLAMIADVADAALTELRAPAERT